VLTGREKAHGETFTLSQPPRRKEDALNDPHVFPATPDCTGQLGLTRRELFAAMAMQALLTGNTNDSLPTDALVLEAVNCAECLETALERKPA
jgi:hypothetical protein